PNLVNNDNGTLKIDYDLSDKQRIFGIFSRGRYINPIVGSLSQASQFSNSTLPIPYTDGRTVLEIVTTAQLHDAYTFSTNKVNDLAWGESRLFIPLLSNTYGGKYPSKAGLTGLPPGVASSGFPDVTFSSSNAIDYPVSWDGTNSHAFNETANTFDVQDNFLWTKGRHQLTFGLQWQAIEDNENMPLTGSQAGFTFNAAETQNFDSTGALVTKSGSNYASYMLGMVDGASVVQNSVAETGMRWKTVAPYVQDNIQVTPKLTVNAGLRWDLWTPGTEVHNRMSFFDPDLTNPATGTLGALRFTGRGVDSCGCRTPIATYHNNWGPRLGFAYSLNNKTVVRGSYSVFYAHAGAVTGHNGNSRQGISQIGFNNTGSLSSTATGQGAFYIAPGAGTNPTGPVNSSGQVIDGSWDNGYPGNPTAPPFINASYGTGNILSPGPTGSASNPMGLGPGSAQTLVYPYPKGGARPPQYQNWTLNIQRSLARNTILSLSYVGSVGHHLPGAGVAGQFTNQIPLMYLPLGSLLGKTLVNTSTGVEDPAILAQVQAVFPGLLSTLPFPNFVGTVGQALKPYPQYNGLSNPYQDVGNSEYHALQVSFNRRMANGLTFMANYSFSKELDDIAGVRLPGQDNLEWSVGTIDQKHVATGTFVYQLPFGPGHRLNAGNEALNNIVGGWQASGIVQEHSGAPMTVTAGCQGYGVIDASCYPNYSPTWTGGSPWQNGKPKTVADVLSTSYLNGAAFASAAAGTYGDAARTAPLGLFAPRYAEFDLSLRKTISIRESMKLTVQADSFNISNSVYFSSPNTTL
ncbi:MAG: TonB-dependent receptor domain-containing protein, partial [bacterium]